MNIELIDEIKKEGKDMNAQPSNYKNKKYTVKSMRYDKSSRITEGKYISIDTSRYDLSDEEIAGKIIDSLKWADKYLRGEVEAQSSNKTWLDDLNKYAEEERKNGRHPGRRGKYRGIRNK